MKHHSINYDLLGQDFARALDVGIIDPTYSLRVQSDRMRRGKSPVTKKEVLDMVLFGAIVAGGYVAVARTGVYLAMGLRTGWLLNKAARPWVYSYRISKEYLSDDLEWEDLVYYAAPGIAQELWDRYQLPKSSPVARRGNAVGPGGGTKTSKKKVPGTSTRKARYVKCNAPGRRQFSGKCVRQKGHSGQHFYK